MERLFLDGPAGPLEALLETPDVPLLGAALLCHPLPTGGGTMNTHAVHRATRALRSLGFAVLRFNFRGVGQSGGRWTAGVGELEDARAAHAQLASRFAGLPVLSGGFSFGSWIGMRIGAEEGARWLLGLGAPLPHYDYSAAARSPSPKAFVLADRDEYAPLAAAQATLARMDAPRRLWVVPGTTHLFTEQLAAYEAAVGAAASWLLANGRDT